MYLFSVLSDNKDLHNQFPDLREVGGHKFVDNLN